MEVGQLDNEIDLVEAARITGMSVASLRAYANQGRLKTRTRERELGRPNQAGSARRGQSGKVQHFVTYRALREWAHSRGSGRGVPAKPLPPLFYEVYGDLAYLDASPSGRPVGRAALSPERLADQLRQASESGKPFPIPLGEDERAAHVRAEIIKAGRAQGLHVHVKRSPSALMRTYRNSAGSERRESSELIITARPS